MRYVITGITGTRNRGVEALLVTTIEQVRVRDPRAEFVVLTSDSTYDAQRCQTSGVQFMDDGLELFSPQGGRITRLLKRLLARRREAQRRLLTVLGAGDVVIASGGDVFTSDYGLESLARNLSLLRWVMARSRRLVFLGHSIGPFKTEEELALWWAVAGRSSLITLREDLSHEYLRLSCPATGPRIVKTADVAFLLSSSGTGEELVRSLGLDPTRPFVACAVSQGISRYASTDAERHRDSWLRCIGRLTAELGLQVLLLPHVQEIGAGNNDTTLCTEILRRLPASARWTTRLAAGDFSAAEYKAIIGRSDLVVAERMHAAIAGLSTCVPTVAIGYSTKARGILQGLLGPELVEELGLLVPIEAFVDDAITSAHIRRIRSTRARITARLRERLPGIEAAASLNFELLHGVALGQ